MSDVLDVLEAQRRSAACWNELQAAARAKLEVEAPVGKVGPEPLIATLGAIVGEVQAERGSTPFGPEGLLLRAVALVARLQGSLGHVAYTRAAADEIPGGVPITALLATELAAVAVRILEEATGSTHAAALALRGLERDGMAGTLEHLGEAAVLVGLDLFRDALPDSLASEGEGGRP